MLDLTVYAASPRGESKATLSDASNAGNQHGLLMNRTANRRKSLRGSAQNYIDVTIRFLQGRLKQVDERLKTLIEKIAMARASQTWNAHLSSVASLEVLSLATPS